MPVADVVVIVTVTAAVDFQGAATTIMTAWLAYQGADVVAATCLAVATSMPEAKKSSETEFSKMMISKMMISAAVASEAVLSKAMVTKVIVSMVAKVSVIKVVLMKATASKAVSVFKTL